MAAGGLARLGELRARQGRLDEARALFTQAGSHLRAIVGLGVLALEAGDPAGAADAAERALRRAPAGAQLDRLPALELLVRARAALGELDAAAEACAELEHVAAELGTPYLRGRAQLAAGRLAAARGDHEEARRAFEDAVDLLVESAAAYEAALARLELSGALAALGRDQPAAAEEQAGARRARRARRPRADSDTALNELTPRELEILRLVAQGLQRRRDRRAARAQPAHRAPPRGERADQAAAALARPPPSPTRRAPAFCSPYRRPHVRTNDGTGRFRPGAGMAANGEGADDAPPVASSHEPLRARHPEYVDTTTLNNAMIERRPRSWPAARRPPTWPRRSPTPASTGSRSRSAPAATRSPGSRSSTTGS